MPELEPIGHDLDLLCEAVYAVTLHQRASVTVMQRRVLVGFAKAGRLLILLEAYGIIGARGAKGQHEVLVSWDDYRTETARLREIASRESASA